MNVKGKKRRITIIGILIISIFSFSVMQAKIETKEVVPTNSNTINNKKVRLGYKKK